MDYSLAALKLLCAQLDSAREVSSRNGFTLGGILFQRAWLQGVLVLAPNGDAGPFLLDDGTGVIELSLSGDFRLRPWRVGMYVMVVGGYVARTGEPPMVKAKKMGISYQLLVLYRGGVYQPRLGGYFYMVHKMVDLSSFPDREAMWYLEVLEAYKLFYQPLIEEFT